MPTITINVTDAELLALQIAALDPIDFVDNVVTNRARVQCDELAKTPEWLTAKAAALDPSDKWSILAKGNELALDGFKTAAVVEAERIAAEEARRAAEEAIKDIPPSAIVTNPEGVRVPSTNPLDWPLSRFQFEGMLLAMGITFDQIETAINAMDITPTEKAFAISRVRNAVTYNRGHPLVASLMPVFNLTAEQVDAAWMEAKDAR